MSPSWQIFSFVSHIHPKSCVFVGAPPTSPYFASPSDESSASASHDASVSAVSAVSDGAAVSFFPSGFDSAGKSMSASSFES